MRRTENNGEKLNAKLLIKNCYSSELKFKIEDAIGVIIRNGTNIILAISYYNRTLDTND